MRDMNKLTCGVLLAALALPAVVQAADEDLAAVVNKANSANNLTKSQLRKLVLGEQASWPSGMKVTVVLPDQGTPERAGVLRSICRMSDADFTDYLKHADFEGQTGGAPRQASSAAAVRQLVAGTPGAIGFLRIPDVDDSVKVVSVDGMAPGAVGYAIRFPSSSPAAPAGAQLRVTQAEAIKSLAHGAPPAYPEIARHLRLSGKVVLEAEVNELGSVKRATLVSGNAILGRSAVEAVERWKFKPFQTNGKTEAAVVTLSFTFTEPGQ